jgi:hypothetical protein
MKEKRAPSRSLSLWAYPALLIAVLVSWGLMSMSWIFNPWNQERYFTPAVKDAIDGRLHFLTYGFMRVNGAYTLDQKGYVTCEWRVGNKGTPPKWDEPISHELPETQRAVFEEGYGEIWNSNIIDADVMSLVVDDDSYFYGKPSGTRLILIKSELSDSPIIINARTLYVADFACDSWQWGGVFGGMLLILSIGISIMGICRLRYRNVWLLAYGILLCVGLFCSYLMGYPQ